ncbi:MAG: sugar ABC transporter permease [Sphaerochaetaceae bacterium]
MAVNQIRSMERKKLFWLAIVCIVPGLLIYGFFNLLSICKTLQYSTLDWNGMNKGLFVGLKNYAKLLKDPRMSGAVAHNLVLMVTSICIQLPFALFIAMALNSVTFGSKFFRTVFFLPMLFSTVATGIMWQLFFDPMSGILMKFLKVFIPGMKNIAFLADMHKAMPAILVVICWQFIPFYMILLKAGLANIPAELYEAATIDGANRWNCFWNITLPQMIPTLRTSAVLSMVGSLKYFDLVWIMTGGGPQGATELMATYMYKKGFVEFEMGYASSIASVMFVICFVFACCFLYVTRAREE